MMLRMVGDGRKMREIQVSGQTGTKEGPGSSFQCQAVKPTGGKAAGRAARFELASPLSVTSRHVTGTRRPERKPYIVFLFLLLLWEKINKTVLGRGQKNPRETAGKTGHSGLLDLKEPQTLGCPFRRCVCRARTLFRAVACPRSRTQALGQTAWVRTPLHLLKWLSTVRQATSILHVSTAPPAKWRRP